MQAAVSLNFTSLHEAAALRPWGAHNDYCGKLHSGRLRKDPKHPAVPGTKSAPQMHLVRKPLSLQFLILLPKVVGFVL
jgi:hypothetical protein